jgi:multicomponent Na+:H+ antiporter subunit E
MPSNPVDRNTSSPAHSAVLFVMLFAFWLLLTGSLEPAELIAGLAVTLIVTLVSRPHLAIFNGLRLTPTAIPAFVGYLGLFLVALVRANLDMARRVLSPSLPLRPALVEIRTGLRSDLGRLTLANSITLTPGTLTVDVYEQTLLIHWIDAPPGIDVEGATEAIAHRFERYLQGFLE